VRAALAAGVLALCVAARAECPPKPTNSKAAFVIPPCVGSECGGPITVGGGKVTGQCSYLKGKDNCYALALAEFDACAPPLVRGELSVDGWCRYYDGSAVLSTYSGGKTANDDASLTFEIRRNGKPCFSLRRTQTGQLNDCKRSDKCPHEIVTEITTRLGTVKYRQIYELGKQTAAYERAQTARQPPGTEVFDQRTHCWGEGWIGFLTCPSGEESVLGFVEVSACEDAFPLLSVSAEALSHALDFAFTQKELSKKSISCGPHPVEQIALGIRGVGPSNRSSPPIAGPAAGPWPLIAPPRKK
jgi:hypothetical protein